MWGSQGWAGMSFLLKITQLTWGGAGFKFRPLVSGTHALMCHTFLPSLCRSSRIMRKQASYARFCDTKRPVHPQSCMILDTALPPNWYVDSEPLDLVHLSCRTRNWKSLKHILGAEFSEQNLTETPVFISGEIRAALIEADVGTLYTQFRSPQFSPMVAPEVPALQQ